jgi:hypothetical protein
VAGYSGRSLPDKLGIKPGSRVAVVGAPPGFDLDPLPPDVDIGRVRPDLDLVMFFTTKRADLEKRWAKLTAALTTSGALWVAWPKKSAARTLGIETDMTEDVVREVALPTGWVDIKVCAVDDTWSGLKCVLRVSQRRR